MSQSPSYKEDEKSDFKVEDAEQDSAVAEEAKHQEEPKENNSSDEHKMEVDEDIKEQGEAESSGEKSQSEETRNDHNVSEEPPAGGDQENGDQAMNDDERESKEGKEGKAESDKEGESKKADDGNEPANDNDNDNEGENTEQKDSDKGEEDADVDADADADADGKEGNINEEQANPIFDQLLLKPLFERREKSLKELLESMDEFSPIIPDAVTDYYLAKSGFRTTDPRIKRLLALATQKFVADIANDAYQFSRIRAQTANAAGGAGRGRAGPGSTSGRTVLTMESLNGVLGDYGINAKGPDFYR